MSKVVIKYCKNNCKHEYQDQVYGKGVRVHNESKSEPHCTVCYKKKKG